MVITMRKQGYKYKVSFYQKCHLFKGSFSKVYGEATLKMKFSFGCFFIQHLRAVLYFRVFLLSIFRVIKIIMSQDRNLWGYFLGREREHHPRQWEDYGIESQMLDVTGTNFHLMLQFCWTQMMLAKIAEDAWFPGMSPTDESLMFGKCLLCTAKS